MCLDPPELPDPVIPEPPELRDPAGNDEPECDPFVHQIGIETEVYTDEEGEVYTCESPVMESCFERANEGGCNPDTWVDDEVTACFSGEDSADLDLEVMGFQ